MVACNACGPELVNLATPVSTDASASLGCTSTFNGFLRFGIFSATLGRSPSVVLLLCASFNTTRTGISSPFCAWHSVKVSKPNTTKNNAIRYVGEVVCLQLRCFGNSKARHHVNIGIVHRPTTMQHNQFRITFVNKRKNNNIFWKYCLSDINKHTCCLRRVRHFDFWTFSSRNIGFGTGIRLHENHKFLKFYI